MGLTDRLWLGLAAAALFAVGAQTAVLAQGDAEDEEILVDEPEAGMDEEFEIPGADEPTAQVPVKPRPAEMMPLAARDMLLDIQRVNGGYVAVGDRGVIVHSPDGIQWTQANVPVRAALTAVHFPTPEVGYAVGHDSTIVATKDGGKTWVLQNFEPELEKPFLDVYFLDRNRGFAVGAYGLMRRTDDGGQTWVDVDAPEVTEEELHFNALVPLNDGTLFLVGEQGMLGVSRNQGQTWTRIKSPYESSLFGAVAVGQRGAVLYGLRGNVFVTTDVVQGHWRELDTGSVATMFGGSTLPDGRVALVGVNGVVFVIDAAGTVTLYKADAGKPLSHAIPYDGNLLAVGEAGVQMIALQR